MEDVPILSVDTAAAGRSARFTELDAQIQAEAQVHQNRPGMRPKPRRRTTPPLPAAMRKEITGLARELNRRYRQLLKADPKLKDRASDPFYFQSHGPAAVLESLA